MKNTKCQLWQTIALITVSLSAMPIVAASEKSVDIFRVSASAENKGIAEKIGTITFEDTEKGLALHTHLQGLAPGEHGFHIHENPSCGSTQKEGKWVAAGAAGGHFDPLHTGQHLGPHAKGHLGDLPKLMVDKHGDAKFTATAEHLKLADIEGRSVMIHEHGDNYADQPEPLGGGGARIACGVIQHG